MQLFNGTKVRIVRARSVFREYEGRIVGTDTVGDYHYYVVRLEGTGGLTALFTRDDFLVLHG